MSNGVGSGEEGHSGAPKGPGAGVNRGLGRTEGWPPGELLPQMGDERQRRLENLRRCSSDSELE